MTAFTTSSRALSLMRRTSRLTLERMRFFATSPFSVASLRIRSPDLLRLALGLRDDVGGGAPRLLEDRIDLFRSVSPDLFADFIDGFHISQRFRSLACSPACHTFIPTAERTICRIETLPGIGPVRSGISMMSGKLRPKT